MLPRVFALSTNGAPVASRTFRDLGQLFGARFNSAVGFSGLQFRAESLCFVSLVGFRGLS